MSYDYHDAEMEAGWDAIYNEISGEVIENYKADRSIAYFEKYPKIAIPSYHALLNARSLLAENCTAAQIFATIAIEVGLKFVFAKPIIYGLIHSDIGAELISDFTMNFTNIERYRKTVLPLLSKFAKVDL
ncbi:MAG: hypothetical protein P9X24_15090 [Candidatus Hatepunaea meridiana]|nr:hypothetical protein [Candidatus Hatepunaea meridiana]